MKNQEQQSKNCVEMHFMLNVVGKLNDKLMEYFLDIKLI